MSNYIRVIYDLSKLTMGASVKSKLMGLQ